MPAPPAIDLKAIEKAAEAGAQRGARLRQDGEAAQKRPSSYAELMHNPAVLLAAGARLTLAIVRLF